MNTTQKLIDLENYFANQFIYTEKDVVNYNLDVLLKANDIVQVLSVEIVERTGYETRLFQLQFECTRFSNDSIRLNLTETDLSIDEFIKICKEYFTVIDTKLLKTFKSKK